MADKNSINLGRVLPIYKGDWSADTNYDILDIVYYNGNSYTAKQPSTNQEPKADSAYWGLSSIKGQKGDKGDQGQKGDKGDTGLQGPQGPKGVIGATGPKGDKGDTGATGPTGKDGISPVIQVNQLFNTEFTPDLEGWDSSETSSGVKTPYRQYIYQGSNMLTFDARNQADKKYSSIKQTIPFATSGSNRVVSLSWWSRIAEGTGLYASTHIRSYDANMTKLSDVAQNWDSSSSITLQKFENVAIPDGAQFIQVTFGIREGYLAFLIKPMLVFSSTVGDYIQGNYYPVDTLQSTPRLNGNNIYVGDNSYMGTNTFMDGVTLNGKNIVNGLTDTDWLDIPLAEGRTGIAKYKVSLGKIFIHLDRVKGMSGVGSSDTASHIGNIPKGGSYFTRNTTIFNNTTVVITCAPNGLIYISGTAGDPPTTSNALYTDFVVI